MNNKLSKLSILALFAIIAVSFSSCKKDDPIPEIDQEEFDGTRITFTAGHYDGAEFHAEEGEEPIIIDFERGSAAATPNHIHLHAGETYRMQIAILRDGVNINADFDAPGHQFFFTGAPAGVLDYEYKDNKVGFDGFLTVKEATDEGFDLNVILRHGLNKSHGSAQAWNSTTYAQAGGTDDLNKKFELHPVPADGHDH